MNGKQVAIAVTPVFSALGMSAVPVVGVFVGGWPPATTMVVYLAETVLIVIATILRLWLLLPTQWVALAETAQPQSSVRGLFAPAQTFFSTGKTRSQTHAAIRHQVASAPQQMNNNAAQSQKRADVIQSFSILAGGFAIVTGIFLLAITLMAGMLDIELTRRALGPSLLTLSACLFGSLAVDVVLIRQVEQIQAEAWVQQSLGRVFLIYLAVFIGVFLALFFQAVWFVTPFIVLKAIVDIGGPVERMVKRFGKQ
jgi:hypothetical protein